MDSGGRCNVAVGWCHVIASFAVNALAANVVIACQILPLLVSHRTVDLLTFLCNCCRFLSRCLQLQNSQCVMHLLLVLLLVLSGPSGFLDFNSCD